MNIFATHEPIQILPAWAIGILIALFVIGIIIGGWGVVSSLKLKTKKQANNLTWTSHFKGKKIIQVNEIKDYEQGIYALSFKNINTNEYFIPVYIFATTSLSKKASELINEIAGSPANIIRQYMDAHDLKSEDIIFVFLEKSVEFPKIEAWIRKIDTKNRGFNPK